MAKNQNDYENAGRELFLAGKACPNGSSWQQAAMRRGWENCESDTVIKIEFTPKMRKNRNSYNALRSHLDCLNIELAQCKCPSNRPARLVAKMDKIGKKMQMLLSSN